MSTSNNPLQTRRPKSELVLGVIEDILKLEPIAFALAASLINGVKGKSDAEILAGDSQGWADIVATAHAEVSK